MISTDRRNKEPKEGQEKTKKQIKRDKTKPRAKNHKTQNKKVTKGGQPGYPVVGRLPCMFFGLLTLPKHTLTYIKQFTHKLNIDTLYSNIGLDVEISSSNKQPHNYINNLKCVE